MSASGIPIDFVASVTPAVVAADGDGVDVVGVLLTGNTFPPIGTVMDFANAQAGEDYFGAASDEAAFMVQYFEGDDDSTKKPSVLRVVQYPRNGVPAYLVGATLATTLATLTALAAGTISLTINGAPVTSGNINLNGATSYSQIASRVQSALGYSDASVTGSITGNVLTVSAVLSGELAAGQALTNAGATLPAGLAIVEQLTGTAGGAGTYQVNQTLGSPVASGTILAGPLTVAYSSQLDAFTITLGTPGAGSSISAAADGTLATALKLTAAAGAEASEGAAAATPAAFMADLVASNPDWVTFTTLWEPDTDEKQAFGAWVTTTNSRYAYVSWSTEAADVVAGAQTGTFYALTEANANGVYYTYAPVNRFLKAAAIMGAAASINFDATNGRRNFCYLTFSGLQPDVTSQSIASILKTKGINAYCKLRSNKTASNRELWGSVMGKFKWMDSYINQVWLNDALKMAEADLLFSLGNIPYAPAGYSAIEEGLSGPIEAGLNFGAIQAGGTLSAAQALKVNTQAGVKVSDTIENVGWALVIQTASSAVRSARTSPPMFFYYYDGQSVQELDLTSTEVQ